MIGVGPGIGVSRPRGSSDLAALIRAALFGGGEVGVMYDPSDLTSMFQDSAGTTAAAIGQPVGLMLDKSQGLVLGSEIITNAADREFSSDTGYWTKVLTTISGGVATVTSPDGTLASLTKPGITTAGKGYRLSFDLVIRSGACRVSDSTGAGYAIFSTSGSKTMNFVATGATTLSFVRSSGVTDFDIDNVTLKELPGYHATQSTSTARGILGTSLIDLDGVDDSYTAAAGGGGSTGFFLCAAVRVDGGAGTNRVIYSDAGTNTGYIMRLNTSNQLELAAGNGTDYTLAATTDTLTAGPYVVTAWDDGTNLNVQVDSGTAGTAGRPVVSAGNAGFRIGKDYGAATGFFNGAIYTLVYVKNGENVDAADRAAVKTYVASKAGVTL